MSLRLDDINMRENAIRLCLQTIDNYLLKLGEQTARNTRTLTQLRQAAGIQGSPLSRENSGVGESSGGTQGQKVRERSTLPHHHRAYNEDKLRPFTDYHVAGARPHVPLQHGMSVDRAEFEQRFGGMLDAVRRGSLGQSEDAFQPGRKTSASSDSRAEPAGNPEHQPHSQSDYPNGTTLPPRFGHAVGNAGRSGSPGVLSLTSWMPFLPLSPIVTPTRVEYTSITDSIDTSCIERTANFSPPNTPELRPRSRRVPDAGSETATQHRKKAGGHHRHRHRRKSAATLNEGLRSAEETEHKQMEVSLFVFLI